MEVQTRISSILAPPREPHRGEEAPVPAFRDVMIGLVVRSVPELIGLSLSGKTVFMAAPASPGGARTCSAAASVDEMVRRSSSRLDPRATGR